MIPYLAGIGLAMSLEVRKKLLACAKFFGGEPLGGLAPLNKSPAMKLPVEPQNQFQK